MPETALPYVIALLLVISTLRLPPRLQPAGGLGSACILLLIEPNCDANGVRIAGPSTGLGLMMVLGVVATLLSGHWRQFHR